MLVLGLETSCDETGVALYHSERGLLADALFSQIEQHRIYGGVVPELASRDHVKRMLPLIREVLAEAKCTPGDIQAVAYTAGPGLVGALLVGASLPRRWPSPGAFRRLACTIWKATCWPRCWKKIRRLFRSSLCWSRVAIPSW